MRLFAIMLGLLAIVSGPARAQAPEPDGRQILQWAYEAAGGENWAKVRTLVLTGHAVFYSKGTFQPQVKADRYAMWRVFDPDRQESHGPEGMVRIDSFIGDKPMFQVAYDGRDTWNEKGKVDPAEAEKFWANNFGFGIIRHALKPAFTIVRLPDDLVDGHPVYMIRIEDPKGGKTLFGIDKKSHYIRKAAFGTARGWHERIYDSFTVLKNPRWVQAGHLRLYYDGVMANEVWWTDTKVNVPIDAALFTLGEPKGK